MGLRPPRKLNLIPNNKVMAINNKPVSPDRLSRRHPMDRWFASLLRRLSRQESTPLLPPVKDRSTPINQQILPYRNRSRTHSNPRYCLQAIFTDLSPLMNSFNLERIWYG